MKGIDNTFNDRRRGEALLVVSPDGQCFATTSNGCDIALWDTETGTHIMALEHIGVIYSLEFLPNGQLVSGNENGKMSLWDIATGTRVHELQVHSNCIRSLSASKSKLASGSEDKTVRVWDTTSWECISTFECNYEVMSVALYPNSDRVAAWTKLSFSNAGRLHVWDTETRQLMKSWDPSYCNGVAVSNDSKWLALASDKTISLYDASTLDCIWSHGRRSDSISFSPDSCQLVAANLINNKVELIDIQTRDLVRSLKHKGVERAIFSHDGSRVISGESCSVTL